MTIKKNIALIGMMGSGKSTIGSQIANKLNFTFIDSDKEIESHENTTIKKIFEDKGEKYFRVVEEGIILQKLKSEKTVFSLGGGSFLNKNIRKFVFKKSMTFWLNWNEETLVKRLINSKKRPLVYGINKRNLINMIRDRSLIYKLSNYKIDCENLSKSSIVEKIINIYENKNAINKN